MIAFNILDRTGRRFKSGESEFFNRNFFSTLELKTSIRVEGPHIKIILTITPMMNLACVPKNFAIGSKTISIILVNLSVSLVLSVHLEMGKLMSIYP